jgi:UDP-N-acetylmuramate--alanine ligase
MIKNIYFIGIGGIGMSALARYFLHKGAHVAGYDLTETPLTKALAKEGAAIHYADDPALIPPGFRDPATTTVVYTPAVPSDHRELTWFREGGFMIAKRAEILGIISRDHFTMAVAGTHGKTTVTTLTAWLNRVLYDGESGSGGNGSCKDRGNGGGSAFLGGISKNFDSNLVLGKDDRLVVEADELSPSQDASTACGDGRRSVDELAWQGRPRLVVEADEYDRSFLRLSPDVAVITSADADHLDIYGTHEAVKEAFSQFVGRISPTGAVIVNKKADVAIPGGTLAKYSYSLDDPETDFYAANIHVLPSGHYTFDIATPDGLIEKCTLGITGKINVENSVAAVALMWAAAKLREEPLDEAKLRSGLADFSGVKRRFDIHVNTPPAVYMDDYAHHPDELRAALTSLRAMFPGRRITAVFQPHLYSRTRDFAAGFAEALSNADELILTPIYPAREEPIPGVDSGTIGALVKNIPWCVVAKEGLADAIAARDTDVVVTFGAGNIDNHVAEIARVVSRKAATVGEEAAGKETVEKLGKFESQSSGQSD